MLKIISLSLMLTLMTSTYADANTTLTQAQEFQSLNHIEAVEQAKKWNKNNQNIKVQITSKEISASFPDGSHSSVEIPYDTFFVSIAPWINTTHPCTNHVPTGCTGELINKDMHLVIKDAKSGKTIKNEKINTGNDGFIDLWLPRNKTLNVSIHYGSNTEIYLEAKETISTHTGERTCITSMKFKTKSEVRADPNGMDHKAHQ